MNLALTWSADVLDSGSMLLVKAAMNPGVVKGEVERRLEEIAKKAPPKGFRPGRVAMSVLRRLHGKRVFGEIKTDLVARASESAVAEAAKKYGFDPKKAPAPTNVKFSEEDGLYCEALVVGLSITGALVSSGSVVDLRKKAGA